MEYLLRQIFTQQREETNNQVKIDVMKRKNEQLLYNILPAHVAKDFVGKQRNTKVCYILYTVTGKLLPRVVLNNAWVGVN